MDEEKRKKTFEELAKQYDPKYKPKEEPDLSTPEARIAAGFPTTEDLKFKPIRSDSMRIRGLGYNADAVIYVAQGWLRLTVGVCPELLANQMSLTKDEFYVDYFWKDMKVIDADYDHLPCMWVKVDLEDGRVKPVRIDNVGGRWGDCQAVYELDIVELRFI